MELFAVGCNHIIHREPPKGKIGLKGLRQLRAYIADWQAAVGVFNNLESPQTAVMTVLFQNLNNPALKIKLLLFKRGIRFYEYEAQLIEGNRWYYVSDFAEGYGTAMEESINLLFFDKYIEDAPNNGHKFRAEYEADFDQFYKYLNR